MEVKKNKDFKSIKLFIIIVLAIGVFFIKEDNRNKVIGFFDSVINRKKDLVLTKTIDIDSEIEKIEGYDNNIVLWKNNKLVFMKLDGTIELEKEFNFEDGEVFFQEENIYVADKISGDIYLFDSKGNTIDRFKTEENLFSLKGFDDKVAYHRQSPDGDKLVILDSNRVNEYEIVYSDKNILTYSMYLNQTDYAVSLLNLNNTSISSDIEIYKAGEKSAEINIENEIIIKMNVLDDDSIVALTDSSIYFIKNEKILWNKELGKTKDIRVKDREIYILYDNSMEIIALDGTIVNKMNLSDDYKKIDFMGDSILLHGSQSLSIINDGAVSFKANESIKDVLVLDNRIFIWNENKLNIYEIKYK